MRDSIKHGIQDFNFRGSINVMNELEETEDSSDSEGSEEESHESIEFFAGLYISICDDKNENSDHVSTEDISTHDIIESIDLWFEENPQRIVGQINIHSFFDSHDLSEENGFRDDQNSIEESDTEKPDGHDNVAFPADHEVKGKVKAKDGKEDDIEGETNEKLLFKVTKKISGKEIWLSGKERLIILDLVLC